MPRVKQKINLQTLKNCAKKTGLTLVDTDLTGFIANIGAKTITYYFLRRVHGKLFKQKIGNYPPMMPEEARREALSMLGKLANYETPETVFSSKIPKLKEAFEWYIAKSRAKNKSHYRSILRHFASIEDLSLGELQRDQVMRILDRLKTHPAIYNNALTYLSGAFSGVCRENGLSLVNPCAGLRKIAQKPRERYLNEDEAPRLLQELERMTTEPLYEVQAWAILMLVYTGARKSEVLSMNLKDIRNGIWVIDKEEYKTGRDFVQELNDDALAIIKERTPYAIDGYLFCRNGARLQDIRRTFHTACLRTGIEDCHPHDLRRTLGTWMLSNGAPIEVVSETLGHTSIRITEQVYAKLLPKKVANATSAAIAKMRMKKKIKQNTYFYQNPLDKKQKWYILIAWERKFPRIVIAMHQHGRSAKMARFLLKETNIYNRRCFFKSCNSNKLCTGGAVAVVLSHQFEPAGLFCAKGTEMQKKVCKSWLDFLPPTGTSLRSDAPSIQAALQRAPPFVICC